MASRTCPKWTLFIPLFIIIISFGLNIASLSHPTWVSQGSSLEFSLTKCTNCPSSNDQWSWECYAQYYCELNDDLGDCKLFKDGYKASYAYLFLEVLSLMLTVMLIEKLIIAGTGGDYGSPMLIYIISSFVFICHLLATIIWFGLSKASWSGSCDSTKNPTTDTDRPDFCAEGGPAIAIANIFINAFAVVAVFFFMCKRDRLTDGVRLGVEDGKWLCLPTRYWMFITLSLLFTGIIFLLAAIGEDSWVKRDPRAHHMHGSLLRCKDCIADYDWVGWDCLAGNECDSDSSSGACHLFKHLRDSSSAFVTLAGITVVLIAMFIQVVSGILSGRDYGIRILNYAYPVLIALSNLLGTIIWFGISKAGFDKNCDNKQNDPEDTLDICSTTGPSLSIVSNFLFVPMAVIFFISYWKRGESRPLSALTQIETPGNTHGLHDVTNFQGGYPKKVAP
ncbi:unnamed protein product [Blepharisma stoltei]|uniref:Uncharacterized protein n=1 Tax=Blepharisma stoltei TaxID=1481888 RepID=A0AAU9IMM5_9CILI|nr:unnamed protein product [Blepharisma stoltei]